MKKHLDESLDESGQTITEYLLLVTILVTGWILIMNALEEMGIAQTITAPIREDFAAVYRYGHPKAKGYEEGMPQNHPRITPGTGGRSNFRIFINPTRD